MNHIIAFLISLGTFILMSAIVVALQRRGYNPVRAIARILSPDSTMVADAGGAS